ncbi:L,D-transpeptidase [Fulvimarina endophytica]|uniref:L,D-transpeptidase n=1 Tax=Fulvimarina endophytica TaxID=2293836 RepID=A0A371X0A1_9HYPH|nr:L,D-transpeptidase [Fulvimarina endophytica]RFC62642.1 L,D-transpeptidase [Fulvimarina endophytica]
MLRRTSKLSGLLAAVVLAASGASLTMPAEAGQRYVGHQPVEVPAHVRAEWLRQLQHAPRVNAAGVVFARPAPGVAVRTQARTIFSPYPFGQPPVAEPRYHRAAPPPPVPPVAHYAPRREVVRSAGISPEYLPQRVAYATSQKPGTIVVDTRARFLYHVQPGGMAMRYGVGVGKEGFSWRGTHNITAKKQWPGWTPPKEMIARERKKGRILPAHMPGGEANPLGARALYLGSTLYRIHGTNQPWTIGQAVSSGCIRMRNEDVEALYENVGVGTKVVVL